MKFSRGLAALILIFFFQISLSAEYLYKDEVVQKSLFTEDVNKIGAELYEKTGISLRLVMLRELKNNQSIVEYEKNLLQEFSEPTILLTFSELNSKVDILANDSSLYKYFDKKQVLSPVASPIQAFVMALFYSNSFENFKDNLGDYGGTILPLLAQKAKDGEQVGKYAASMFNGYGDIADQIAKSKNIVLENGLGDANKDVLFIIKFIFYSVLAYAMFAYMRRKLSKRGDKNV